MEPERCSYCNSKDSDIHKVIFSIASATSGAPIPLCAVCGVYIRGFFARILQIAAFLHTELINTH